MRLMHLLRVHQTKVVWVKIESSVIQAISFICLDYGANMSEVEVKPVTFTSNGARYRIK